MVTGGPSVPPTTTTITVPTTTAPTTTTTTRPTTTTNVWLEAVPSGTLSTGEPVGFAAVVSRGAARSTVSFTANGSIIGGCGSLAPIPGIAVCATSFSNASRYTIVAAYSGNGTSSPSSASISESQSCSLTTSFRSAGRGGKEATGTRWAGTSLTRKPTVGWVFKNRQVESRFVGISTVERTSSVDAVSTVNSSWHVSANQLSRITSMRARGATPSPDPASRKAKRPRRPFIPVRNWPTQVGRCLCTSCLRVGVRAVIWRRHGSRSPPSVFAATGRRR
jgi:hypothetical protein